MVKCLAYNVGDLGLIPGLGRSSGEGNGNPLQYSCLENPMDRGALWATVQGVAKIRTRLSDFTFTFSAENLQVRREWNDTFKVLKEKSLPNKTTLLSTLSSRNELKNPFPNKQNLREFITTSPSLQEILNRVL